MRQTYYNILCIHIYDMAIKEHGSSLCGKYIGGARYNLNILSSLWCLILLELYKNAHKNTSNHSSFKLNTIVVIRDTSAFFEFLSTKRTITPRPQTSPLNTINAHRTNQLKINLWFRNAPLIEQKPHVYSYILYYNTPYYYNYKQYRRMADSAYYYYHYYYISLLFRYGNVARRGEAAHSPAAKYHHVYSFFRRCDDSR